MAKGRKSFEALREQAGVLDLTHDTVFVRDMNDVITYWNRGAAELYGWTREETIGKVSHQLMQTTFPAPLEEINAGCSVPGFGKGNSSTRRKRWDTGRGGEPMVFAERRAGKSYCNLRD
jgi:PAS domain S-box-containing protein